MPALLALTAAAFSGTADFVGGYATRRTPVLTVTLISNVVGVTMALGLVVVMGGAWTPAGIGWGAVGGACGLLGLLFLYLGLAGGPNRLVSPLSVVLAAAIPVAFGLATGDHVDQRVVTGLLLAPFAIWLVAGGAATSRAGHETRCASPSERVWASDCSSPVLAQTPDDAGPRCLSSRLEPPRPPFSSCRRFDSGPTEFRGRAIGLPVLTGVLDMTANGLFLWSSLDGDLSVVGALVSLFPVTTILLALAVLHERLSRSQAIGLGLAVGSATLLS